LLVCPLRAECAAQVYNEKKIHQYLNIQGKAKKTHKLKKNKGKHFPEALKLSKSIIKRKPRKFWKK